jgi:hypothetical protein
VLGSSLGTGSWSNTRQDWLKHIPFCGTAENLTVASTMKSVSDRSIVVGKRWSDLRLGEHTGSSSGSSRVYR